MTFKEKRKLNKAEKHKIVELWNNEYPKKLIHSGISEFEKYLKGIADKQHIILYDDNGDLKGWLIHFIRENERWFAMLLDPSVQGKGFGSRLLDYAKRKNTHLNGWVIDNDTELKQNGKPYISPVNFYKKNSFQIHYDVKIIKNNVSGIKVSWKNG